MTDKAIEEIAKGDHHLKHVDTVDKSTPLIEGDVKIKKVDRDPFLKEVVGGAELSHVEAASDRSAPKIDDSVHVKKVDREGFLKEIEDASKK